MTMLTDTAAAFAGTAEDEALPAVRASARTLSNVAAPLALAGVSLSFGGVVALRNVDLAFGERIITAVIGPNGSGKTSLINVICGVYKPDSGRVVIAGRAYKRTPTQKLASLGVARTFQNLGLFKGLSAFDNIAAGLSFAARANLFEQTLGLGRARREAADLRRRVDEAIELLHLQAFRDRLVGGLPYGVQKRIELARAIVASPKVLLLDEPLAGMTMDDKAEMSSFIRTVQRRLNATVVLIEHDIGLVMSLSDRVAVFDYGAQDRGGHARRGAGRSSCHRRLSRRAARRDGGLSRAVRFRLSILHRSSGWRPALRRHVCARRDRLRADLQDLRRAEFRARAAAAVRGADLCLAGGARRPPAAGAARHLRRDGADRAR